MSGQLCGQITGQVRIRLELFHIEQIHDQLIQCHLIENQAELSVKYLTSLTIESK